MNEMLFSNARFNPSMAVPMSVTVTIPITMPSVVRIERSLFARMALQEIARPSRSSVRKFIGREADEWIVGFLGSPDLFVTGDEAVADANDPVGVFGDVFLVRDEDDG